MKPERRAAPVPCTPTYTGMGEPPAEVETCRDNVLADVVEDDGPPLMPLPPVPEATALTPHEYWARRMVGPHGTAS